MPFSPCARPWRRRSPSRNGPASRERTGRATAISTVRSAAPSRDARRSGRDRRLALEHVPRRLELRPRRPFPLRTCALGASHAVASTCSSRSRAGAAPSCGVTGTAVDPRSRVLPPRRLGGSRPAALVGAPACSRRRRVAARHRRDSHRVAARADEHRAAEQHDHGREREHRRPAQHVEHALPPATGCAISSAFDARGRHQLGESALRRILVGHRQPHGAQPASCGSSSPRVVVLGHGAAFARSLYSSSSSRSFSSA